MSFDPNVVAKTLSGGALTFSVYVNGVHRQNIDLLQLIAQRSTRGRSAYSIHDFVTSIKAMVRLPLIQLNYVECDGERVYVQQMVCQGGVRLVRAAGRRVVCDSDDFVEWFMQLPCIAHVDRQFDMMSRDSARVDIHFSTPPKEADFVHIYLDGRHVYSKDVTRQVAQGLTFAALMRYLLEILGHVRLTNRHGLPNVGLRLTSAQFPMYLRFESIREI